MVKQADRRQYADLTRQTGNPEQSRTEIRDERWCAILYFRVEVQSRSYWNSGRVQLYYLLNRRPGAVLVAPSLVLCVFPGLCDP